MKKNQELTLTALFIALLIVASQVVIPIGPVSITLQTLVVLVIGYLFDKKIAIRILLLYMIIGLIGVPAFSQMQGGPQSLLTPSFGFIIGFIPAAGLQSFYLEKNSVPSQKQLIMAGLINIGVTYLFGMLYMTYILNNFLALGMSPIQLLMAGMLPFIPLDILKMMIAIVIARRLKATSALNRNY